MSSKAILFIMKYCQLSDKSCTVRKAMLSSQLSFNIMIVKIESVTALHVIKIYMCQSQTVSFIVSIGRTGSSTDVKINCVYFRCY